MLCSGAQCEAIDVVIVGGGIVGLWTAYEILQSKPGLSLVLLEKEQFLAEHSSGRNSEVLHAGMYYEYESLKHQTCIDGNRLWRDFVKRYDLPFLDCGKYIVATNDESEKHELLYQQGVRNHVPGLRWCRPDELGELCRQVKMQKGFYSPSSAVLSISDATRVLKMLIEELGGIVLTSHLFELDDFCGREFFFSLDQNRFKTSLLINAGGLFAVDLRKKLGLVDFENKFVKGNYLILKNKTALSLKQLIYPMPPAHGLGLGVHLTLDVAGGQKFGPNTEEIASINYSLSDEVISQMQFAITDLFPSVTKQDLALGYSGIRSKVVHKQHGLSRDFIIGTEAEHGIPGYYEYLGIESPGVTASPALASRMRIKIFG